MSLGLISDCVLILLVLGLAVWVSIARTAYRAVVGFVAYGLLMSFLWVRLSALDVAMTEAALGSGLTGILLFAAAARLAPFEAAEAARAPGPTLRLLVGLLCTMVAAGLGVVVLLLPEPAPTLAPWVAENLPSTGLQNPVTAVLLVHRAIDTLLESVVLLPALIGVWSVAADSAWGGRPGSLPRSPANDALTLLARILPPFGVLVGIHLVWNGADEPGGKFQGATVLAAMWVLVMMAGLRQAPTLGGRRLRWFLVIGALLFIVIGVAGIWLAGDFLAYPHGWAKPLIVAIEVGLTLSVALVLGLLLAGPPRGRTAFGDALMSGTTLFGLGACALVGLGLYGLICQPGALRKILAFNLLGSGIFLLFGVIAKRGGGVLFAAGAGSDGDPVPQALVITGLVVAFAATAIAVALLVRLAETGGGTSLDTEAEPKTQDVPAGPADADCRGERRP